MITILDRWIVVARCLARMAVWVGGTLMLGSAFLVSIEVLLRKLFLVSIGGADELSGYAFAIGTSWGFAFALLERANVRVDALYTHLGSKVRAFLDILALVALGLFVALLAWHAVQTLATSLQFSSRATTPLATPLWIPQGLWVVGFGLFLFSLAPLLLRALMAFSAGDMTTVRRLAGARSVEEEATEETGHAMPVGSQPDRGVC